MSIGVAPAFDGRVPARVVCQSVSGRAPTGHSDLPPAYTPSPSSRACQRVNSCWHVDASRTTHHSQPASDPMQSSMSSDDNNAKPLCTPPLSARSLALMPWVAHPQSSHTTAHVVTVMINSASSTGLRTR